MVVFAFFLSVFLFFTTYITAGTMRHAKIATPTATMVNIRLKIQITKEKIIYRNLFHPAKKIYAILTGFKADSIEMS